MLAIVVARALVSGILEKARYPGAVIGKGIDNELLLSKSHDGEKLLVALKLVASTRLRILR